LTRQLQKEEKKGKSFCCTVGARREASGDKEKKKEGR